MGIGGFYKNFVREAVVSISLSTLSVQRCAWQGGAQLLLPPTQAGFTLSSNISRGSGACSSVCLLSLWRGEKDRHTAPA
jgi:hypothetical protein